MVLKAMVVINIADPVLIADLSDARMLAWHFSGTVTRSCSCCTRALSASPERGWLSIQSLYAETSAVGTGSRWRQMLLYDDSVRSIRH